MGHGPGEEQTCLKFYTLFAAQLKPVELGGNSCEHESTHGRVCTHCFRPDISAFLTGLGRQMKNYRIF